MTTARISVAMSVYNNAPYLAAAVESILAQSFGAFEFLIVDDGSTDGSGAILDAYAARDPRIRVIRQENRGLIASLNRLIEEAQAPLIARMDGDDIALPTRFERQLAFLDSHPDHGVVGTWSGCIDEKGALLDDSTQQPTSHEAFVAAIEGSRLLCHSSVMMRRDIVRAAGGYRPAFRHCEDYDLWLRLVERTRICSIPEQLLLYRYSEGQVSSRHVVAQQVGAAVALAAHCERAAGRPDPTEGLESLPALDELDRLFGRQGVARTIRAKVAPGIVHSREALQDGGLRLILDHIDDGGHRDGLWRTAARLLKMGEPRLAIRLAAALATR